MNKGRGCLWFVCKGACGGGRGRLGRFPVGPLKNELEGPVPENPGLCGGLGGGGTGRF